MVKGYEFAKDQYVQFTAEEIKAMEEAGTHSVDIAEFVPIESIDPVYFDKTYYLAPDKGGEQALRPAERSAEGNEARARSAAGRRAARRTSCCSGRSATCSRCSSCTSPPKCARPLKWKCRSRK